MRYDKDLVSPRTTMRRASAVLILLLLISLTLGTRGVAAQTDDGASDAPLDLPALVLRPADLPAGYGVLDGLDVPPMTGVVAEYWAELGLPDPASGGASLSRKAITRLAQYEDADAAQERLDSFRSDLSGAAPDGAEIVVADENGQPIDVPRQLVPDAPIVADDTVTTTLTTTTAEGTPVNAFEIFYRTGRMTVEVSISDFTATPPAYDEVAALAHVLLDRVAGADETSGPGWSYRALRFDDEDDDLQVVDSSESYLEIGGEPFRTASDTDESFAARAETWAEGNVRDVYHAGQTLGQFGNDDPADQLFYVGRIYGFGSDEDAKAFIATAVDDVLDDPSGYASVEEERVSGFGGEVGGIAYEVDLGNGDTSSGHRIWVQDGRKVVSVQVDSSDGVALDGVKELARMQIACAEAAEPCEPVEVPEGVVG